MATKHDPQAVVHPTEPGKRDTPAEPPWRQLLQSVHETDRPHDVALLNLVCTSGLRGAHSQSIEHYLQWLDDAAEKVRLATERNYFKFLDAPGAFENSQARFCMVCLVTVLQRECSVRYNPKWKGLTPDCPVPEAFGIDGIGGTCGSLPVLYVAVGRRIGYPLRLVKAARHLFVRWDDPDGRLWHHSDRFNVEATGPGIHFLPDEHYRTWPHAISAEDVEAGIFLRSLSPREELAEFVATRGYCLKANGRLKEAVEAFAEASRLAPHNRHFAANHKALQMHLMMRQRGHAFLNAPVQTFDQEAVGPFWVAGLGGHKVLVQIVSPVTQPFAPQPDVGVSLVRQSLQTPNGLHVEAWLPVHSAGSSMTAHWVRLPDSRLALVHKPASVSWAHGWQAPNRSHVGYSQPILPGADHGLGIPWSGSFVAADQAGLAPHEQSYLEGQIQQTIGSMHAGSAAPGLPSMQPLALPAGPAAPRLPQTIIGIPQIIQKELAMYADLGPGQMIDLEPPSPNGVDLLYSHEYVARSRKLYAYLDNNPLSFVDPYGLETHILCADGSVRAVPDNTDPALACGGRGGPMPINPASPPPHLGPFLPQPPSKPSCSFMVRGDTTGDSCADSCGLFHVDLYSTRHGEVRTGFGGSTDPKYAPSNPTQIDPKTDTCLTQASSGTLAYGPNKGTSCTNATYDQILACIRAVPKPSAPCSATSNNCRQDISNTVKSCCLSGF